MPEKPKNVEKQLNNKKRKQANWQIVEHMGNYHERRVQQGLGEEFEERICQTRDATLAEFRSGTRLTKKNDGVVNTK